MISAGGPNPLENTSICIPFKGALETEPGTELAPPAFQEASGGGAAALQSDAAAGRGQYLGIYIYIHIHICIYV